MMNLLTKPALAFQALWTLLAFGGVLFILEMTLGVAAWNGVNFVVAFYLLLSVLASIGLLLGVCFSFSIRPVFSWITAISAFVASGVSLIYIFGFTFSHLHDRTSLTVSDTYLGGLHAPLLAFYGAALLTCSIQGLISIFKIGQLKNVEVTPCPQ